MVVPRTMELVDRHVAVRVPAREGRVRQSPSARVGRGGALPRESGDAEPFRGGTLSGPRAVFRRLGCTRVVWQEIGARRFEEPN